MPQRGEERQDAPEWIGVDLDATLAEYTGWAGAEHIGKPIPRMVQRVLGWLQEGKQVKIVTARASDPRALAPIRKWLAEEAGLPVLDITNQKGHNMVELWDDRCRQVVPNTGEPVISDSLHALILRLTAERGLKRERSAGRPTGDPGQFALLRQLENDANHDDEEES